MKLTRFKGFVLSALVASSALMATACGNQEYLRQETVATNLGADARYIPGKVDIVILMDNSPSVNSIMTANLEAQISSFAASLKNKFWDYHLGKIDMLQPTNPIEIGSSSSKFAVNTDYNQATLPDGSQNFSNLIVPASAIIDASQFKLLDHPMVGSQGDPAYSSLLNVLTLASLDSNQTHFLRPDALLAVVVITNGYARLVSGQDSPYVTSLNSQQNAQLQSYANQLIALKGSRQLVRFYPVAADRYYGSGTCMSSSDGVAFTGVSYTSMLTSAAGNLLGQAFNFCNTTALANVMAAIDENLTIARQDYVYSYLVLDHEPRLDLPIRVVKNTTTEIPAGSVNGWEYVGFGTVHTITAVMDSAGNKIPLPQPGLNQRTGYLIKLNGTAEVTGAEKPEVFYTSK